MGIGSIEVPEEEGEGETNRINGSQELEIEGTVRYCKHW